MRGTSVYDSDTHVLFFFAKMFAYFTQMSLLKISNEVT